MRSAEPVADGALEVPGTMLVTRFGVSVENVVATLVFLLRWFWWRVNAFSEIAAMSTALASAIYFNFIHARLGLPALQNWQVLIITVAFTTTTWLLVTLLTRPADEAFLRRFYSTVRPGGPGWAAVRERANQHGEPLPETAGRWEVPTALLCAGLGCVMVYAALFAVGNWIYGRTLLALILLVIAILATVSVLKLWGRLQFDGAAGIGKRATVGTGTGPSTEARSRVK